MKKIFILLLALAMVFSMTACGQKEAEESAAEGLTAIPLGGDLGEISVEGDPYGIYTEIDFPEGTNIAGTTEAHLYAAEGCDTPYIGVYRWANEDGKSLEDEVAAWAEEYESSGYRMFKWDDLGGVDAGCFVWDYTDADGNFYYVECDIMLDGDEFVSIDYYCSTEEVALGESGQYVYVPTGYNDILTEEDATYGGILFAEYAEGYDIPMIWICDYDNSYDYQKWVYQDEFPDGLPVDENTYNGWLKESEKEGWTEELNRAYYEGFGYTFVKSYYSKTEDGAIVCGNQINKENEYMADIYITVGDKVYNVSLVSETNQLYAAAMVDSIHSK